MTKDIHEMTYDEIAEFAEEVNTALIRRAYSEGYKQGKFDAEMNVESYGKTPNVREAMVRIGKELRKMSPEQQETPQQKRDRIVEQAKADVEDLEESEALSYRRINYVVNKEKRTIVTLVKDVYFGEEVAGRGIAKCAPGDCFNVHIGKAIALRRALGLEVPAEYKNAPQPTEVRVGDEIYDEHYQMSGKVYAINPEYRTYGEDAGYYFGKSKGCLTYIDPRNYERRIERKFVKVTDDSREEVSE